MSVNKRLRELREKRGLSQQQVADYLGIKAGTYSTYETGRCDVGSEQLKKLVELFGVSADFILGVEDSYDATLLDELLTTVRAIDAESLKETLDFAQFLQFKAQKKKGKR